MNSKTKTKAMKKIKFSRKLLMLIMTMLSLFNFVFSQEQTYKVGDLYENGDLKGIVFVINESGTHGKIISIDETVAPWVAFLGAVYIKVGTSKDEVDGSKNMKIIMNASGWQETYTAANWCYKHGEKWYLPSISELQLIFANRDILNQTLTSIEDADELFPPKRNDVYLSSAEMSNSFGNIYAVSKKGKVNPYGYAKNLTGRVRAVCKF
jgi:hypothetical protein